MSWVELITTPLIDALEEQWLSNHMEHCSSEWPHPAKPVAEGCYWPRPAILEHYATRIAETSTVR